jgi:hypothetical protein
MLDIYKKKIKYFTHQEIVTLDLHDNITIKLLLIRNGGKKSYNIKTFKIIYKNMEYYTAIICL